ncbi:isochorismatase family protein [Micromonospora yasonensis]|uniref:isochorismatase family protein n=1 Tax=Micromonospora yasonensis TaxID=1128667 RepID=UPI0022326B24|nr:isochorismatase family protein [Micromonospora yasonensis]MCW3844292.1 isochorismatase family protein [Micromonospora yasonensis]
MTTLVDRPHTALLVIDVQNGVVNHAYDRDRVVANVATLVDRARAAGVAVVWVQDHSGELVRGSEPWQYVPELVRRDDACTARSPAATTPPWSPTRTPPRT